MHYSEEEKAMRLEEWRQSGKSAWAYAKENRLNYQTFKRWVKPAEEIETCFVEVPPVELPPEEVLSPAGNSVEILIGKGEVKIHIPLAAGVGELRAIFSALGGAV